CIILNIDLLYMIILLYNNKLLIVDNNTAMNDIYYQKAVVPNKEQIAKFIAFADNKVKKFFSDHIIDEAITLIKKELYETEDIIPLYDIYTQNIYLVDKYDVYNRIIYSDYRPITEEILDGMIEAEKSYRKLYGEEVDTDILTKRKYRKAKIGIAFISFFDLSVLYKTYTTAFYNYANDIGKNITTCRRPSFLSHFIHIKPYYTQNEIINLALNMGI